MLFWQQIPPKGICILLIKAYYHLNTITKSRNKESNKHNIKMISEIKARKSIIYKPVRNGSQLFEPLQVHEEVTAFKRSSK